MKNLFILILGLGVNVCAFSQTYWKTSNTTVVGKETPKALGKIKINIPPESCVIALDSNSFTKVVYLSDTVYVNRMSLQKKILKDEFDLCRNSPIVKEPIEIKNIEGTPKKFSCDDIKIITNEYTKIRTIETGYIDFSAGTYSIYKEKGIIYLYMSLKSYTAFVIDKGEIFYLKLENGTILKFPITSSSLPDYSSYNDKYTNSVIFVINASVLNKLSKFKIKGIKCFINEYDLENDESEIIMESFKCLKSLK